MVEDDSSTIKPKSKGTRWVATATTKVRVCFVVKLGALIPYYERDLFIIERVDIYIYIYTNKMTKM